MYIKNILILITIVMCPFLKVTADPNFVPVCERSKAMQSIIQRKIYNKECDKITERDLATFTEIEGQWRHYRDSNYVYGGAFNDGDFTGFINVKRVSLEKYPYYSLPENVFLGLHSLLYLYITGESPYTLDAHNPLEYLPKRVFANLRTLEVLTLSGHGLTDLDENIFNDLQSLKRLDLTNNVLQKIPENIFSKLQNLNHLDLSQNPIRELPSGLFRNNPNLGFAILNKLFIDTVPSNLFRENEYLERVELEQNLINKIEARMFKGREYLLHVNLKDNRLDDKTKAELRAVLRNKVKLEWWER